jgi:hypothetical protein
MNRQQWTLVSGVGMGAGLMYLLDPQGGRRRRALVKDKAVSAYSSGSDVLRKTSKDLGNRSKGLAAGVRSKLRKVDADDLVLRDRVRSKMGRWVSKPGAIDVTVEDSVVILRGEVPASEVDHLLKKLRKLKGVEDLRNELDLRESGDDGSSLQEGACLEDGARNWSRTARLLAGTAGGALAVAALARRDKLGAALGTTLGTVGLGLLAGGVGGSNVNPKRLLGRRGRKSEELTASSSEQLSGLSAQGSGQGPDEPSSSFQPLEGNRGHSEAERFDFEPSHSH